MVKQKYCDNVKCFVIYELFFFGETLAHSYNKNYFYYYFVEHIE